LGTAVRTGWLFMAWLVRVGRCRVW
jgi:hypothetical protein